MPMNEMATRSVARSHFGCEAHFGPTGREVCLDTAPFAKPSANI